MMTKSGTITDIMQRNPTAGAEFLSRFSIDALRDYLARLDGVSPTPRTLDESTLRPAATNRAVRATLAGAA